jgi:hypothetical protein
MSTVHTSLLVRNRIQNNFLFSFLPSPSSSQRSRAKAGTARARPIPAPAGWRPQPRTVPPTRDRCAPTATHGWARRGPQPAGHDSHSRSGGSPAAKAHQGAAGRRGQPSGTGRPRCTHGWAAPVLKRGATPWPRARTAAATRVEPRWHPATQLRRARTGVPPGSEAGRWYRRSSKEGASGGTGGGRTCPALPGRACSR